MGEVTKSSNKLQLTRNTLCVVINQHTVYYYFIQ